MRTAPSSRAVATRLTLVLLGCLALTACKGSRPGDAEAKEKKGPEAVPVEVALVATRPIAASYTGTAPLEPRSEAQVVAKTSGVALAVFAEEGQAVRAGQTLVRLDASRDDSGHADRFWALALAHHAAEHAPRRAFTLARKPVGW